MASISYALRNIAPTLVQAATLLLCFGSGALLDHFEQLGPTIVVLTVVLGLTLGRTYRNGDTRQKLAGFAVLPLVSMACTEVGRLFIEHPTTADALFTAALGASIWMRRFGPRVARLGTLVALPFIALLVTPVPVVPVPGAMPAIGHTIAWSAVASVIALCWVWITQEVAERSGLVEPQRTQQVPQLPQQRRKLQNQSQQNQQRQPRTAARRIAPSTRMAVQMTLSVGLAFVIGRTVFSTHWAWIVMTAFIVNSGNRGRGDVVHKSLMRIAGASVGTVIATLLAGLLPPRDNTAIVIILIVVIVGSWLRTISYTYWAGCVTAVLSLLQGYFGETHVGLIGERLLQIVLGGALAVAIAWFVLPIKSTQALRRRLADCLAPLTEALRAAAEPDLEALGRHHAAFRANLAQLELTAPSIVAHRRLHRLRGLASTGHPADAIDAVRACAEPLSTLVTRLEQEQEPGSRADPGIPQKLKAVMGNVVAARMFIGRREGARYRDLPHAESDGDAVHIALRTIDEAMGVICEVYGSAGSSDAGSGNTGAGDARAHAQNAPTPVPET